MKKHNMMRVASALAVVTLLSTSVISGTLAKYTSTASGSSTAKVATWLIKAGTGDVLQAISNNESGKKNEFTFDLFKSVLDENASSNGTNESEEDVKKDNSDNPTPIIAPGTMGYVDLKIENDSEVNATYTISFADGTELDSNKAKPNIQYARISDTNTKPGESDWRSSVTMLDVPTKSLGMDNTDTYRIYWKWAYVGDDTADTQLGTASTVAHPSITATVTATQAD